MISALSTCTLSARIRNWRATLAHFADLREYVLEHAIVNHPREAANVEVVALILLVDPNIGMSVHIRPPKAKCHNLARKY
jgi:hypothetical protein